MGCGVAGMGRPTVCEPEHSSETTATERVTARHGKWLWTGVLAVAFVCGIAARIALFEAGLRHIPLTTDESVVGLQAMHIARGEPQWLMFGQPYLFPLDSYCLAPLASFVPRNAASVRYLLAIASVAFVWMGIVLCRRIGALRDIWPGLALVLLPSAYVVMLQSGYLLPGYLMSGVCLIAGMVLGTSDGTRVPRLRNLFLAAVLMGLAMSGHLVMAAGGLVGMAFMVCGLSREGFLRRAAAVLGGACVGLLPLGISVTQHAGAHEAVVGVNHWSVLMDAGHWRIAYSALGRGLAFRTPLFPDFEPHLDDPFPFAGEIALVALGGILVLATVAGVRSAFARAGGRWWPKVRLPHMAIAVVWATLAAFLAGERADGHACRYLLPMLWCMPIVVAYACAASGPWVRRGIAGVAIALAALNALGVARLSGQWRSGEFAQSVVMAPPLQPLIDALHEKRIAHVYAGYWLAYRVTYASDERIICSQPFNERFPGWPLPYVDAVRRQTNVAAVVSPLIRRRFSDLFSTNLDASGIGHRSLNVASYTILYDFTEPPGASVTPNLPPATFQASASHNPAEAARLLLPGVADSGWRSRCRQKKGMWIQVATSAQARFTECVVDYGDVRSARQPECLLKVRRDGEWVADPGVTGKSFRCHVRLRDGFLKFGDNQQRFDLGGTTGDAVRVEIVNPRGGEWAIDRVELRGVPLF